MKKVKAKRVFNRILCAMIIMATVFSLNITAFADSDNGDASSHHVEAILELQNRMGAEDFAKFEKLTESEQKQFLAIVNDENLALYVVSAITETDRQPEARLSSNEAINLKTELNITDGSISTTAANQSLKATYTKTVTALGIEIFEATGWVRFYHDGKKVTSISGKGFTVGKNYVPLLDFDFTNQTTWKGTTYAYASSDFTMSFISDSVAQVAAGCFTVYGNIDGSSGGYTEGY